MAYTNFPTAWAAFSGDYDLMSSKMQSFETALSNLAAQTTTAMVRNYTVTALTHLRSAFLAHAKYGAGNYDSSHHYMAVYYASTIPGGGEINFDTILSLMLIASFDQLQKFIGIEDAYRVALWNAPFNANFYAALARGFQQWP